jgi:hypothetical protein
MAKIPDIQSDLNKSIFTSKITLFQDVAKAELKLFEAQKDLELEQARASRAAAEKRIESEDITTDYIVDMYDQTKNAALTNANIIGKTFDQQAEEIKRARNAVESARTEITDYFAKIAPGKGDETTKRKLIEGAFSIEKTPQQRAIDLAEAGLSQPQLANFKQVFNDYITNLADIEAAEAALADRRVESAKKIAVEQSKQIETKTQADIKATEYELSLLQEVIDKENETVENKIAASDKKLELTRGLYEAELELVTQREEEKKKVVSKNAEEAAEQIRTIETQAALERDEIARKIHASERRFYKERERLQRAGVQKDIRIAQAGFEALNEVQAAAFPEFKEFAAVAAFINVLLSQAQVLADPSKPTLETKIAAAGIILAQGLALVASINASSYAKGGYTGDGGKYEEAGTVHRGEYVLTKEATARIGVSKLDSLNYGGYSNGGAVVGSRSFGFIPKMQQAAPVLVVEQYARMNSKIAFREQFTNYNTAV